MKASCGKIAILGPGAMGQIMAATLSSIVPKPVLVDYRPDRARRLNRTGIKIVEQDDSQIKTFRVRVAVPEDTGKVSWVILLVKSYHTADTLDALKTISSPGTMILLLQNGIGQEDVVKEVVPEENIALGITAHGAAVEGNVVRHSGIGMTVIGPLDADNPYAFRKCEELAAVMNSAGWETDTVYDIAPYRWKKLIANCAINPLTAITGVCNGELYYDKSLRKIMNQVAIEAFETALAAGIKLDCSAEDMLKFVQDICLKTACNRSSMLQDISAGRMTEIDNINCAVLRIAELYGISVPGNEILSVIIKKMEMMEKNKKKD
jgi:2-dehydropantoate 2-reductase